MKKPKITFFSAVASHNLERFHSECLAWLFNTEHEIANRVIQKFSSEIEVEFVHAFTEVQQLDLVLYYRSQGVGKAVIIENKIKASEGRKKLSEQEKRTWASNLEVDSTLYQTEYYYLRPEAKKNIQEAGLEKTLGRKVEGIWIYDPKCLSDGKKQEAKIPKGSENWVLIQKENCFPIYLIPAKWEMEELFKKKYFPETQHDFSAYNTWREKELKTKNPWKTITYGELLDACGKATKKTTAEESVLVKAYLAHLKQLSKNYQKALISQLVKYSPSTFGAYEYFKVLASALTAKNKDIFKEVIARPGSSNSGDPILDIYFTKKITIPNEEKIYSRTNNSNESVLFSLGIQLQGYKVKLFIAANDYENVKVIQPKKYASYFFDLLKKSFYENNSTLSILGKRNFCQVVFESGIYSLTESLSKGKSFMDYYFPLVDYFDKESPISFEELFDFLYALSEEMSSAFQKSK